MKPNAHFVKVNMITGALDAAELYRGNSFDSDEIDYVIASDLMSDVLAAEAEKAVLVTSLASEQSIRTADVVGAVAVIIVNGKPVHGKMISLAAEFDISLLSTPLDKFRACVELGKLLGM